MLEKMRLCDVTELCLMSLLVFAEKLWNTKLIVIVEQEHIKPKGINNLEKATFMVAF